ncbi:hypothetical protein ACQCY2_21075 [Salmonella enterica]
MELQAVTSVITSVLTVVIALFALFSWRKQEQLKTKLAFKNAIADYANQLKKNSITSSAFYC